MFNVCIVRLIPFFIGIGERHFESIKMSLALIVVVKVVGLWGGSSTGDVRVKLLVIPIKFI